MAPVARAVVLSSNSSSDCLLEAKGAKEVARVVAAERVAVSAKVDVAVQAVKVVRAAVVAGVLVAKGLDSRHLSTRPLISPGP